MENLSRGMHMAKWKICPHVSKRSAASAEILRSFPSLNFNSSLGDSGDSSLGDSVGLTKNLVSGLGD